MNFLLDKLDLRDHDDFRKTIGRTARELSACLKAQEAEFLLTVLGDLSPRDVTRLCNGEELVDGDGEERPAFRNLRNMLLDTKESLESESTSGEKPKSAAVRRALKTELEDMVEDGGDWAMFLAFLEYVLCRKEDPTLRWETFRNGLGIYDGADRVWKRIGEWQEQVLQEMEAAGGTADGEEGEPDPPAEELPLESKEPL